MIMQSKTHIGVKKNMQMNNIERNFNLALKDKDDLQLKQATCLTKDMGTNVEYTTTVGNAREEIKKDYTRIMSDWAF